MNSSPNAQSGNGLQGVIEVSHLTKAFGKFTAVDDLSFTVSPGQVTGFLGPNGAGKTTTLRMLLGLIRITSGTATIGGRRYTDLRAPRSEVGAMLESTNFHPGRTSRDHLRVLAAASNVPVTRVDELLELVGLPSVANKRVGGYSMGMRQRLGLAAALLGDPAVLLLDEPANGLDPEGIRWLRGLLRHLADEGRTILVSSHILSEIQQSVDHLVIIANGRNVMQGSMADLEAQTGGSRVIVRTPDQPTLGTALDGAGLVWTATGPDSLEVLSEDHVRVGDLAFDAGVRVHELRTQKSDLEQMFLDLTTTAETTNRNVAPAGADAQAPAAQQGGEI